jgi:hypothetical protein
LLPPPPVSLAEQDVHLVRDLVAGMWALFALNFSWSTLVLLVGGLTIYAGRLDPRAASGRALVVIVAVFWTVHGVYMVVEPMPVPPGLAWIQGPIVAFPATLVVLLGLALLSTRHLVRLRPRLRLE